MQAETTRFDRIMGAAFHLLHWSFPSVIAQSHPYTIPQTFHRKHNQLIVTQIIRIPDDVSTCFIHSEDNQHSLSLGQRIAIEEFPNMIPHQDQVPSMTTELDSFPLHCVPVKG